MSNILKALKPYLFLLNQLFEIEQKVVKIEEQNSIARNIERLKNYFENDALESGIEYQGFSISGLYYHNPLGEKYNETRLDCEATISGTSHENLKIIDVIKPIIFAKSGNSRLVVQKGVVIVQSEN
ncbi:hypothetical protein DIU31_030625 [Mucilaginibacter rubeus]|uniref:Uncharacterized protein n=1 Tax=Mucilaginibacter rubeus TaxID=2027860 RepID=A0AAE6JLH1_9SPHI|nr:MULTISPECIES: hypothetical protein [Mucilaginibacter]QEM07643.1 hypothetical protein DIU31_030625 [Mucilaginibacter rubeus]QEM20097.1 hypothetical protein DIU38_030225 [Mucilaginibacter gossypii]QTE43191.1 hypothetical protein J3L19_30435 [Mucilaginibacter rubeus]QTE49791.1 hypothetical protein J3L21_30390 [Mucilaginibacter rubeus]QTE54884.1 hypothetical protein J3L23_22010 [Mucilaginibacter rubeus]